MARGWATSQLAREAWNNVTTSRRRLVPLAAAAVILGSLTAIVSALDGEQLRSDLDRLNAAGRNVVVIGAAGEIPTSIDRTSCDELSRLSSVQRSGAILPSSRREVLPLGTSVPVVEVTGSIVPELALAPAVIGEGLPLSPSNVLISGTAIPSVVGSEQPEGVPLGQAVAVAAPATVRDVERCIVVLEDYVDISAASAAALASLNSSGPALAASVVLSSPIDRLDAFSQRLTIFSPVLIGLLGAGMSWGVAFSRSSELAAYRLSGARPGEILTLGLLETAILTGAFATSCTAAVVALSEYVLDVPSAILHGLVGASVWLSVAGLGHLASSRQSVYKLIRDR